MNSYLSKLAIASIALAMGTIPALAQTSGAQPAAPRQGASQSPSNTGTDDSQMKGGVKAGGTVSGTTASGTVSGQPGKAAASDSAFIKEAAAGSMKEVELGKLAEDKATNDQVKQFAQRMVQDHGKAGDQLKKVALQEGVDISAVKSDKWAPTKDKLSKASGSDFDRQYMSEMLKDHRKDVAEFEKHSQSAKSAAVKQFASSTLPTLQEHLKMAEETNARLTGSNSSTQGLRNPAPAPEKTGSRSASEGGSQPSNTSKSGNQQY